MRFEVFKNKIWLATPTMHGDEMKYVQQAYDTNWMSTVGENINEVERIAAEKSEMKYAVALSCCTAALHLAVKHAGETLYGKPAISHGALEGKRVFCSDMTFDATLNPVVYEGGIPVFIDTEEESWNMDPVALEKAFEMYPDVKLVVSAELYGFPGRMDIIKSICEKHGALLIEDAAEAMGATINGRQCGSFGDYSAISYKCNERLSMYKHFVKRLLDIVLSTIGIIVLAIPMLIVAIMIKIDSPGPVLFKQRRIGLHKKEFIILKFRSMPVSAPSNVATHQLDVNAIQMSKFQKAIRKLSIDELPQLYNIWIGSLSVCGPRPALYNQANLVAERDKYGANDVKPGLTGWAQINGRDELEIEVKAKLDGEYTAALNAGHFKGFAMDCRCFWGTIKSVLKSDGVVEGGTGELKKQEEKEKETIVE